MISRTSVRSVMNTGSANATILRSGKRIPVKIVSRAADVRFGEVLPCGVYKNTTGGKPRSERLKMAQKGKAKKWKAKQDRLSMFWII